MDNLYTKLGSDVPSDNVRNDEPPFENENVPSDSRSCHASCYNDPYQQPPQGGQTAPVQRSEPQPVSTATNPADCFESMIAELRSEPPPFHPFPSGNEPSDCLVDTLANDEALSGENTDVQKTLDDLSNSMEQRVAPPNLIPDRSQIELIQPSETTSKVEASADSESVMNPPERSSSAPQNALTEDPLAFGSLQIPIFDQYPCFQVSSDGDNIEIDDSVFKTFRGDRDGSMDCNIVTVGTFLELNDLPKLKPENLPKLAPEHVIENPLSVPSLYKCFSNVAKQETQGNGSILKRPTGDNLASTNFACSARETKSAPSMPCQDARNFENTLKSDSDGNHIALQMATPSAAANTIQDNSFSSNQILDSQLLSLLRMKCRGNKSVNPHLNSPYRSEEVPNPLVYSLSDMASAKQSSNQNGINNHERTPSAQGCNREHADGAFQVHQPNVQRKRSNASSNHRQNQSVQKVSPFGGQASLNLSLPIQPRNHPNVLVKGHRLVTPTSIICPQVPFQFQNKLRQDSNLESHNRVKDTPFDINQMSLTQNVAWGKRTADNKRRICEVGSSYQTPPKKSRAASSKPTAQQEVRKKTEDTSYLSRHAQMQQIRFQSPNISSSTHPITNESKSNPRSYGLTQHFVAGLQFPPGGVAQSTQGPASEATVSSPSKRRSINVREERGHLLKRFVCSDCPESYAFKENCERHYKVVHQGRTVYFCFHCPASYLQSKTMRCHVDKKHHVLDGKNSIFPCYWCEFKTNTEVDWTRHVSEMHPGNKNSFRGNNG